MERTLLGLLSDVEDRKDLARSAEAADVLAETTGENDPASRRYQAGLRYDIRRDERLISVTEFTLNIIGLTKRSLHPSRQDRTNYLCSLDIGSFRAALYLGKRSAETHHCVIIVSLKFLASTLECQVNRITKAARIYCVIVVSLPTILPC